MERQQSTLAEGSLLSSTTITPVTHPKNTLLSSLHQTFKGSQTFMLQPRLVGHTIKWKQTTEIITCTHTHTYRHHPHTHTHTHTHTHAHAHRRTRTDTHTFYSAIHTHTDTHMLAA